MTQNFPNWSEAPAPAGDSVRTALINNRERTDALRSSFQGGFFPSDPVVGQLCYRHDLNKLFICKGVGPDDWVSLELDISGFGADLVNDVDAAAARSTLGLGDAALSTVGLGVSELPTTAQADGRYLQQSSNLSDLTDATSARNSLGLGTAATENVQDIQFVPPTGVIWMWPAPIPPATWLLMNGETLGSATSAATHADNLNEDLFKFIWENWQNELATVSPGPRGINASVDWNDGKTITIPNASSRFPIGAGNAPGLTVRALNTTGGEEDHTLVKNEVPALQVSIPQGAGTAIGNNFQEAVNFRRNISFQTDGGSLPHNNTPAFFAVNFIIKR